MIIFIALGLLLLLTLIFVFYFNRILILSNRIDNAWSQMEVQLKRRSDLVPNLVETVKGYARHEKSAIKMVTDARTKMLSARGPQEVAKSGNMMTEALKTIFALAENYPQLKANENFQALQAELSVIEDKIAFSRMFYNDAILIYNNTVSTFPGNLFAKLFGKGRKDYIEIEPVERAVPKISFEEESEEPKKVKAKARQKRARR